MATAAHCAYCFEILSSSLEKRQPLSLQQVEALWAQYDDSDTEDTPEKQAEEAEDEEGLTDAADESLQASYRPAAVNRLLVAPRPSSASSSSPSTTSSTPSVPTPASSATSKSSSRSSFFSLGRQSQKPETSTEEYPLFVTWNTVTRSGARNLRGCIGTFEDHELEDGLRSYALTS